MIIELNVLSAGMWKKFVFIFIVLILLCSIPSQEASWKENSNKATQNYANKEVVEGIKTNLKWQLEPESKLLEKVYGKNDPNVLRLREVFSTDSQELNKLAESLASGEKDNVMMALKDITSKFGTIIKYPGLKSIYYLANKRGLKPAMGSSDLFTNAMDLSEAMGSYSGTGDTQPLMEFVGSKIIDLTPAGPLVQFYQVSYGIMEYGHDKFVNSEMERLYQEFKSGSESGKFTNDMLGRDRMFLSSYADLITIRMKELRKNREEEFAPFKDKISDELYRRLTDVDQDKVIDDMINSMNYRMAKERADAINEKKWDNAKKDAEIILDDLEWACRQKYGPNWENIINFDEATLVRFIQSVKDLRKSNKRLSLDMAAMLQAVKLVFGENSEKYESLTHDCDRWLTRPPAKKPIRVIAVSGGGMLINRGNISGRDPLGFLECLCASEDIAGVHHFYEAGRGCIWGNWGVNRGPVPTVSDIKNSSCANAYGITEMRTNVTPLQPIETGGIIKDGEQIQTTGKSILAMPDGSTLLIDPRSAVTFTRASSGKVLVDVQQGSARVFRAPGEVEVSNVEVKLGDKKICPKGTEFIIQWDGKTGSITAVEGFVGISNTTISTEGISNDTEQQEIYLEAGEKIELPAGRITPYNISTDDEGMFVGIPLRELILDDSDPEPYRTYEAVFADGRIPEGWIWQDPGNDAKIETPEPGTLMVTVPDGNELWGYPGYTTAQRTDAPRLLHKVTGDFDLEGELLMKSNCTNYAGTQFVLYSPGSHLGVLANQMKMDGLGEDYRIMGGSWSKSSGLNKLDSFNKEVKDCPDAPNTSIKVKLTRRGDVWKSYWSLDGNQWNLAGRQEFNASDTVWVGWVFKRNAYDGLTSEPAIITLKDVRLTTAPRDSMEFPKWDLAQWAGTAKAENTSICLALNGSILGSVRAFEGGRIEGGFEAVVRFNTSNWTGQEGVRRAFGFFAGNFDEKNLVYIALSQQGTEPRRYASDLEIDGSWNRYKWIETSDLQGYLRIVRHSGNFSTYYWSECRWVPLAEFGTGFKDPVYIGVDIDNANQATKPVPLAVDFNIEQIQAGEAASGNWTPTYCSLIQPVPLPEGITLPQGVEAMMFKPVFALGTIFFGPDGTAYAFSSERGKQKLMAIDSSGTARTYAESEILAGINGKTGLIFGSNILMTVDGWYEGGNRYNGIYALNPNGTFRQWNLKSSYGGLGDIITAPEGGWYFSDFEADNVWHLPAEGVDETPLITKGDYTSRIGLKQMAYDKADGTLYALDNYLDFRNAGKFAVYKITSDGEAVLIADINTTSKMNGGMAMSSNGPFGHALYVSDAAAGKVLKMTTDGTFEPVITGLIKPGEMQFNPVNGDLLIVCDDGKSLLWVGSDLSLVGTGSSAGIEVPVGGKTKTPPSQPTAGPAADLSGDWIMQGRQIGLENSDFKAVLTLNSDGTLSWLQTEGANVGATRNGTWEYSGSAVTMKWSSLKGGQITWTSSSISDEVISDGTYTAEHVPGGNWSAIRSIADVSEQKEAIQSSSLFGDWKMEGKQTGVENSDFKATLTLNSDGTLNWVQTEGANVGATRSGTWEFDGKTLTMKWSSSKGGLITWTASSVTADRISDGTYVAELVSGGTWSAAR